MPLDYKDIPTYVQDSRYDITTSVPAETCLFNKALPPYVAICAEKGR